jgi:UDP-N-acetylmuramate dehydrogenase
MPLDPNTAEALSDAGIAVQIDAPLARRTWWRAGGAADALLDVPDLDTLQAVRRITTETGCPLFVLGNASNLLISDAGVRGVVLRLTGDLAKVEALPDDQLLIVGGGAKLVVLTSRMLRNGWTGLEWMAGIPGTVGGAVKMNAGTSLGEAVDSLLDVGLVTAAGTYETLPAEALGLSYRTSHLPDGSIVAHARFRMGPTDPDTIAASAETIQHHLDRRRATQPIDQPSCGSTFRNPPGDHAGRLIEAAGLKGFRIGDAQVSQKHANFLVNLGGATATDIRRLVEHVQQAVEAQSGVRLVREVHYAGDWSGYDS